MFGDKKDSKSASTIRAVEQFNEAFNRQDVDAVMSAMTDDCVFENTYPAPDGTRYEGQRAVRAAWQEFFHSSPNARFEAEDMFATADRCTVPWRYSWTDKAGVTGHIRGVDVFRVRDGKIAEKLSYVKG